MITTKETSLKKDVANKKITISRAFDAPVQQVWKAWTDSAMLDMWWAPKPWKARTKSMDFREGGYWLYCMAGPNGEETWARMDYQTIANGKRFIAIDSFCDENGNKTNDLPGMHWKSEFIPTNSGTRVEIEITFATEADLQKILEMGFQEGFAAALGNLDELLAE